MPIKLVIFDCDGVMFDSLESNVAYYNHIRTHFGLPELNQKEIEYVHMGTDRASVDYIMPENLRAKAHEYRRSIDYAPFVSLLKIEPNLKKLLSRLHPEIRTAVCTNRNGEVNRLLEVFRIRKYFDLVITTDDVRRPKPDPEPIHLILDRLGMGAQETLFIGDSENDARSAKTAGVCLALYGNRDLEADYYINGLDEIQGIIDSLK